MLPTADDENNEPLDPSSLKISKSKVRSTVPISNGNQQRTQEQFEELVKQAPNDSQLWIEYMQFYIDQAEIDRARTLAERALTNIFYR